jgi:hypothetical protein
MLSFHSDDKVRCMQVEYDPDYWGGDYSKVGRFVYLPFDFIDRCPKWGEADPVCGHAKTGFDGRVKMAFHILTGVHPNHIIHYSPDEGYDLDGEVWQD